jgi:hypothetical protein
MIYDINHSQVSPNRLYHHLLDFMQVRSVPFSRLASISAVLVKFWWRQYFQERANPIVAKINCTKATQSADLLTRAAIDMRYVAGDLSSWADETTSPRADIKRLINRLDNCIAKLLAIRRATRRSWRLGNSRMKPQNQLVHSGQAASRASTNLLKGEIMSRAANPQTGARIISNPASRSLPNSFSLSSMATSAAREQGERSTENSPDELRKSRFQKACPGQVGTPEARLGRPGAASAPSRTTVLGGHGIAPGIEPPCSRLPQC